jgi:hypothetical protein
MLGSMKLTDDELRIALEEIAKRPPSFSVEAFCFDEQIAFIRDPANYKVAVCSRRAGKTIACAVDLLDTALQKPKCASLYITLSRLNAKRIIWAEILEINRKHELGGVPNETELSIRFPNGHIIYFSGAKDKTEVEKYRGFPLVKVYIDEAQAFRPYIESLVDDVLSKSLFDYDGTLCLIGTPGPVPVGYFYQASQSQTWSQHGWTMLQNPWLERKSGKKPMELILKDCKRMGVLPSDPKIQRECFGKWVTDSNALVFKYDDIKNNFINFKDTNASYVIGVDLGFNDADAIAVLGWNQATHYPGSKPEPSPVHLVHELVKEKQGITELADQLDKLVAQYNPVAVVMDAGGLGKKIVEELKKRFGLPIRAAEKARKFEYIELLNDALRNGQLLARSGGPFASDTRLVEWDRAKNSGDRLVISDVYHSDIADAVLYAFRESLHWVSHAVDTPTAKPGSDEWMAEQERLILDQLEKDLEESNDDPITWTPGLESYDDQGLD